MLAVGQNCQGRSQSSGPGIAPNQAPKRAQKELNKESRKPTFQLPPLVFVSVKKEVLKVVLKEERKRRRRA
jgi:hypothetical protein